MQGINEERLEDVVRMIDNYFGIEVDVNYVRKILLNSEDAEWLQQEVRDNVFTDTIVRDTFAEAIAQDLVGCSWPIVADGNSTEFFSKLKIAAWNAGFSTIWDNE